jgi:hypothetical protein
MVEYRLDIEDFASEGELMMAVKRIIQLNRDKEFTSAVADGESGYLIEGKGYRLIISGCDCGGKGLLF